MKCVSAYCFSRKNLLFFIFFHVKLVPHIYSLIKFHRQTISSSNTVMSGQEITRYEYSQYACAQRGEGRPNTIICRNPSFSLLPAHTTANLCLRFSNRDECLANCTGAFASHKSDLVILKNSKHFIITKMA